ncbi:MAG: hypothetical protein PSV35_06895 [bacterium]|nr:hypothetical protein [bacterium]
MPIDASLFAHIENDAFISGTFGLQSNHFANTTQYLKEYVKLLISTGNVVNPKYLSLLDSKRQEVLKLILILPLMPLPNRLPKN